ncbi:hypothetical protein, partial [Nostoc sp.]|uniref:hypothetical protein n=1 Tax=Nostoc sp. TaxID=1180 RepID=UPI002FF25A91
RLSSPLLISDRLFFSDFLCCIYYLICQCVSPDRIQESGVRIQCDWRIAQRKAYGIASLREAAPTLRPGFLTTPLKARACAGEQGSRGAGESSNTKFFPPLPLCPSAPLLYQTPEACEKCGLERVRERLNKMFESL